MIKAVAGDIVLLGITDDNLMGFETKGPIYIGKEELGIDIDIQLHTGGKAYGIDGRNCLAKDLDPQTVRMLKKGGLIKLPRTQYSAYEVLIFYGKTSEDCIKIINEAMGREAVPSDLRHGEAVYGRMVDGQQVQERRKVPPSIFSGGVPR